MAREWIIFFVLSPLISSISSPTCKRGGHHRELMGDSREHRERRLRNKPGCFSQIKILSVKSWKHTLVTLHLCYWLTYLDRYWIWWSVKKQLAARNVTISKSNNTILLRDEVHKTILNVIFKKRKRKMKNWEFFLIVYILKLNYSALWEFKIKSSKSYS